MVWYRISLFADSLFDKWQSIIRTLMSGKVNFTKDSRLFILLDLTYHLKLILRNGC